MTEGISTLHDFDLLLIPANRGDLHWVLVVVDIKSRTVSIVNSMKFADAHPVEEYAVPVLDFLNSQYKLQRRLNFKAVEVYPAHQDNMVDCGLYTIFFMSAIARTS